MKKLSELAGNAVLWQGGQLATATLLGVVRLLVLSWLLTPADFGLFAVGLGAIGVLVAVTDFGMVAALVQQSEVEDHHYDAAWTLRLGRAVCVTLFTVLGATVIADLYEAPGSVWIVRAIALKPTIDALGSIRVAHLTRELKFGSLAVVNLSGRITEAVLAIALASVFGVWAMMIGLLSGAVVSASFSYVMAPYRPRILLDRASFGPLVGYGRWVFVTGLVTASAGYALQIIISRSMGVASLGVYFLVMKLAFLPTEVTNRVVQPVAFSVYAAIKRDVEQCSRVFRAIVRAELAVVMPGYVLLFVLAPSLEQDVLGARWAGTAALIRLFALVGLVGIPGGCVVPLLKGHGVPHRVTALELIQGVVGVGSAVWLVAQFGLPGVAGAMLAGTVFAQVVSARYVMKMLEHPFRRLAGPVLSVSSASFAGGIAAFVSVGLVPGPVGVFLAACVGGVVILGLVWAADRVFALGLRHDLLRAFPRLAAVFSVSPGPLVGSGGRD